ncbi:hypothetical protein GIB67_021896, partial [Kingdonia uniflora]
DHLVNNVGIASLCTLEEAPDITTYQPIMCYHYDSCDIESEMSKGRVLSKDGKMIMDPELQNVQVGMRFISEKSIEDCAKDIMKGVYRGNCYITQPYWSEIIFWWKTFFLEALEWRGRMFQVPKAGKSQ